jgi:chloride channel protein, CIC family
VDKIVEPQEAGELPAGHAISEKAARLGDFTTSPRVLLISVIALIVGSGGVMAGVALLQLIRLCTNLAYFGRFTLAHLPLGHSPWGLATVLVPVAGALVVGLMAR